MKRFSVRLFALGLGLGVLGTAAVLAVSAYASTSHAHARTIRGAATLNALYLLRKIVREEVAQGRR